MTQLIKYEETYLVTYKDGTTEEISKTGGEALIKMLIYKSWVIVNGNGYSRFEILSCKKLSRDSDALGLLSQQPHKVQDKVRGYMKFDKKELTLGRMQNMIEVAERELYIK